MEPERRRHRAANFIHSQGECGLFERRHQHSSAEESDVAALDRAAAVLTVLAGQSLEGLAPRRPRSEQFREVDDAVHLGLGRLPGKGEKDVLRPD